MLHFFLFGRAFVDHLDNATALFAGVAAVAIVVFLFIVGEDTQFVYILKNLLDFSCHETILPLELLLINLHTCGRGLSLNRQTSLNISHKLFAFVGFKLLVELTDHDLEEF
jgi:hypothetical protein